jgi:Holliday junction resolvase RusA-like endonuclease
MIKLTIAGNPMGKQRARTTMRGFAYTPKNTVNYETLIKELFMIKYPDHRILEGAVILKIAAYYPIPKSTSNKKKELMTRGEIRPTVRPDFDNVIKIFADALSALAYKDDSQVVGSEFCKYYSDSPRCEISIEELSED